MDLAGTRLSGPVPVALIAETGKAFGKRTMSVQAQNRISRVFHSFTETVKSSKSLYSAFLICPDDSV